MTYVGTTSCLSAERVLEVSIRGFTSQHQSAVFFLWILVQSHISLSDHHTRTFPSCFMVLRAASKPWSSPALLPQGGWDRRVRGILFPCSH